jgi:glycosyltransferase involved in cell wall biosynthesis
MRIAIRQLRGNSGTDIWAESLCHGLRRAGQECTVELRSPVYQFLPPLSRLRPFSAACDIIQGNSGNAFAFKEEIPLVVTEHHVIDDPAFNPYKTLPQKIYHRWIYYCERKSLKVADTVVCVSYFTAKRLDEVYGFSDTLVIYNGIDTSVFRPAEPASDVWNVSTDKTVLFFAGNLSRRKGADLLPPIMKQLGEKYVLLIAAGQHETSWSDLKNIVNIGHLDLAQLVLAFNRCDIFLSASRLEGFGLSVAEAMACGKPVVATNGSSLPELVVDGQGGFLCRMNDANDFADKIRHLAADDTLRKEMGMFNRQRVEEKFTLQKMTDEYLAVYRNLLP